MKYLVQWNYRSSLAGPWMKGDVVELDERLAEAVNRDSPGVLKPAGKKQEKAEPLSEATRKDRMVREAETHGRGVEDPMTTEDFKAVTPQGGAEAAGGE